MNARQISGMRDSLFFLAIMERNVNVSFDTLFSNIKERILIFFDVWTIGLFNIIRKSLFDLQMVSINSISLKVSSSTLFSNDRSKSAFEYGIAICDMFITEDLIKFYLF